MTRMSVRALKQGVGLLGGVAALAAPDENILLKPNVLTGAPAERCVCTHPRWSRPRAVCSLRDAGG